MSTSDTSDNTNSTNTIALSTLQCEIKLVNNWKKLQLRSRFTFSEIDPIEIKAMMINYYSIYCLLETKLEFSEFTETFNDIPNINNIIAFLNNQSKYKIIDDSFNTFNTPSNNTILLSIQIELPIIVLPIVKDHTEKYHFYGFANGKLLLYHNNEETNNLLRPRHGKHKIYYKDILSMFNNAIYDNYTFGHPKNIHFELNQYEECNIYELNELELEMINKPNVHSDRCVICLSSILYSHESYCRISSCKHIYHYDCIENLIKYSNDNQCPLCRGKIKYVQYLNQSINKIFKIKNNNLAIISHKHYFNKYYFNKKNKTNILNHNENEVEYDEKEEGIIASNQIPPKPCLGFLESMPSPTNSDSSISIPPTRHSSPSMPDITQLRLNNNDNNNNNANQNQNNNNNNGNFTNNNNNNNNNGNNAKSLGYFDTNSYDKKSGEDD